MRRIINKMNFTLPGIFLILYVATAMTFAQSQTEKTSPAEKPKIIETQILESPGDFMSAGQNVELPKEGVNGDAAVAGMNVNVEHEVKGYTMAAGMNVNVNAPIGNDLWAAGMNVSVNDSVADNVNLAGGSVLLSKNSSIGSDAKIAGNRVDISGRIARNLKLAAEKAQLSGEVGGNVTANVGNMTLAPGALVRGDLIVNSPNAPVISSEAKVLGKVDHRFVERGRERGGFVGSIAGWLISWMLSFIWLSVLGIVFVLISSVTANRIVNMMKTNPGGSALAGFLAVIAVPVAAILLLITVIGLKVAFVLVAVYVVAILMSGVFVSYFVGEWILRKLDQFPESHIARILVGAFVVTFAYSLPWIGFLATLAVLFFGVGALVLERRMFFQQVRAQGLA